MEGLAVPSLEEAKTAHLAAELKVKCYPNGKEIDPKETAKVLHKLGKAYSEIAEAYRESDSYNEKVSLIRSAVLYNAALMRNADSSSSSNSTEEVQRDLEDLCARVLAQATGSGGTADGLRDCVISCKRKAAAMRKIVIETLAQFREGITRNERTSAIEALQERVYNDYGGIMKDVMAFCLNAFGGAPCRFALVGMGSYARKEITPFSDFEHIYVLEDDVKSRDDYTQVLETFRWMTVLFQLAVVNMGETLVPHASLPLINDPASGQDWFFDAHTTRGICFDGMVPFACKFPLGKPPTDRKPWKVELIKPVSDMLLYLSEEEDIRNGYHLADMLTKTSYVCGDQAVFDNFEAGVRQAISSGFSRQQLCSQVRQDWRDFNLVVKLFTILDAPKVNMKRIIYRSVTLFVAAMARIHRLWSKSSFDVIRDLAAKMDYGEGERDDLLFAVAVACEVRLRLYSEGFGEADWLDTRRHDIPYRDFLLQTFGREDTVRFLVATCRLQMSVGLDIFPGEDSPTNPRFLEVRMLGALQMHRKAIDLCERWLHENSKEDSLKDWRLFVACLAKQNYLVGNYIESIANSKLLLEETNIDSRFHRLANETIGDCHFMMAEYAEAIRHYEQAVEISPPTEHRRQMVLTNLRCVALCYLRLGKFQAAVQVLDSIWYKWKSNQAFTYFCLDTSADCYFDLQRYDVALEWREKCLGVCRQMADNEQRDAIVASQTFRSGKCYVKLNNVEEAEKRFTASLSIFNKTAGADNIETAECFACLAELKQSKGLFAEAFEMASNALKQLEVAEENVHVSSTVKMALSEEDPHVIKYGYQLGARSPTLFAAETVAKCREIKALGLMKMRRFDEAAEMFESELQAYQSLIGKPDTVAEQKTIECLTNLTLCYEKSGHHEDCMRVSRKAEEYYSDRGIPDSGFRQMVCISLMRLERYEEALRCCREDLEALKKAFGAHLDSENTNLASVAKSYFNLGLAYQANGMNTQAVLYHKLCLVVYNTTGDSSLKGLVDFSAEQIVCLNNEVRMNRLRRVGVEVFCGLVASSFVGIGTVMKKFNL